MYPDQSSGIAFANLASQLLSSTGTQITFRKTLVEEREPTSSASELANIMRGKSPNAFRILLPLLGIPLLLFGGPQISSTELAKSSSAINLSSQFQNLTSSGGIRDRVSLNPTLVPRPSVVSSVEPVQLASESPERKKYESLSNQFSSPLSFFNPSYEFQEEKTKEQLAEEVLSAQKQWEDAGQPYDETNQEYQNYNNALNAYLKYGEGKTDASGQLMIQEKLLSEVAQKRENYNSERTSENLDALKAAEKAYLNSVAEPTWVPGLVKVPGPGLINEALREKTRNEWISAGYPAKEFDSITSLYQTSLKDALREHEKRKATQGASQSDNLLVLKKEYSDALKAYNEAYRASGGTWPEKEILNRELLRTEKAYNDAQTRSLFRTIFSFFGSESKPTAQVEGRKERLESELERARQALELNEADWATDKLRTTYDAALAAYNSYMNPFDDREEKLLKTYLSFYNQEKNSGPLVSTPKFQAYKYALDNLYDFYEASRSSSEDDLRNREDGEEAWKNEKNRLFIEVEQARKDLDANYGSDY